MAQSNQLPHHAHRFGVFTCFDSLPRHTAAAIGIISTCKQNLAAVIDTRRTGQAQQQGVLLPYGGHIAAVAGKKARRIMGIQQIKQAYGNRFGIGGKNGIYFPLKSQGGQRFIVKEFPEAQRKRIIHYRIQLAAAQPRQGTAPYFTEQVKVFFKTAHPPIKLPAKCVRKLIRNIEPEPVNIIAAHPCFAYVQQVIDDGRIIGIQLRHRIDIRKNAVSSALSVCTGRSARGGFTFRFCNGFKRPFLYDKPIEIRRGFSVADNILPQCKVPAAVVKDAIQHHFYTACMGFFHQRMQIICAAECRIDIQIIGCIILMHTRRNINRIKI